MKKIALAAAMAVTVALAGAQVADAQTHRSAIGVNAGGTWFSDLNRGAPAAAESLTLGSGWIVGAQAEHWLGNGRFGLRLNGNYTNRPLQVGGSDLGMNQVWFGDLDLMARLLTPQPERNFAPFVQLGFGIVHYDPPEADMIVPSAQARTEGSAQTQLAGVLGAGTDIFLGDSPLMLRLEIANHFAPESPWRNIETNERYDAVSNWRLTAGLHTTFGQLFPPPPVAVAPPPAPPAEPAPPPPPEPVEETVLVCVIDPDAPGGIRVIEAIHLPETDERFVIRDGERVRLETTLPRVELATEADWFVRGEPMAIEIRDERVEFVTFGSPRVIEHEDLVFLGTVNGMPVYGARADVDARLVAQPGVDLTATLREDPEAWRTFREMEVLYVPADATGCVFVPVQRVEEVLKVRG